MNCPICYSLTQPTEFINSVLRQHNQYCEQCDSYHIPKEVDMSAYYGDNYHKTFNFKPYQKTSFWKSYLSKPRNYARCQFLEKHSAVGHWDKVLEIGGGNGEFYTLMDRKYSPKKYTIVEPNPTYNLQAKNLRYFNTIFEKVDNKEIANTDLVILFHVLEHIYDVDEFFARLKRLNVKNLLLEVPNIADDQVKYDSLTRHPHFHHYSEKSLNQLFEKNKISKYIIQSIKPITYHPYKKVPVLKRVFGKIIGRNEIIDRKGLYLRALMELS